MLEFAQGKRRRVLVPEIKEPPAGRWSNCYVIDKLVVLAGMTGRNLNGEIIEGDSYRQSVGAFQRIKLFVEAAGAKMNDIVKLNGYLTDMQHLPGFVKARAEFFS